VLRDEASEIRHLLLQSGDLRLQGVKPLGQGQQRSRKLRPLADNRGRWLLREESQAALMQASEHLQVLAAQPFFAAIAGMAKPGELRIRQPAAQRFGIDAQATTPISQRDKGHGITPFV